MNVPRIASWCIVAGLLALCVALSLNNAIAFQQNTPGDQEGVEILTRAPIHECFAGTVTFDPEPGLVAPKMPPPPIEELPPQQRPEGPNVDWIPGYWAWDEDRDDFVWISGIWRAIPPGRQWVPGVWSKSGRGAQWRSGFWFDAKATEIEYLPEPPQTVETGPNSAALSPDDTWLPGCWIWQQNRYAWRPGYWTAGQSDWDWVPDNYVWTPRGYVFVGGYYDYSLARRGVLFAPVYIKSRSYLQPGFSYTPSMVVSPAVFARHLFLRPSYGHYYYGDYYGSNYSSIGFSPWFSFHSSHRGYDPFYAQQRWVHRHDRGWEQNIQTNFQKSRDQASARPPRTWADQRTRQAGAGTLSGQASLVAASLAELASSKEQTLRFQLLEQSERQQFAQREQAIRQLREQRQKLEDQEEDLSAARTRSTREFQPVKLKLPPSPFMLPVDRLGKDFALPKLRQAPPPDLKIAPTARKARSNAIFAQEELDKTAGTQPASPPQAQPQGKSKGKGKNDSEQ